MSHESDRCNFDTMKSTSKIGCGSPKTYTSRSSRYSIIPFKKRQRMERRKILDISIDKNGKKSKRDQTILYRTILIKTILKRLQDEIDEEIIQERKSYAKIISADK